jgi:hypothetical protein
MQCFAAVTDGSEPGFGVLALFFFHFFHLLGGRAFVSDGCSLCFGEAICFTRLTQFFLHSL